MSIFTVEAVQYGADNYAYLLLAKGATSLIDCGDHRPVLARLKALNRKLDALLLCHMHADHTAGTEAVMKAFPKCRLYAPVEFGGDGRSGRVSIVTEGSEIVIGTGDNAVTLTTLSQPAHTRACVNYSAQGVLFTSDTLFSAGCGRLFEGTAADLTAAMARIKAYPAETKLYFGHEYTRANLEFARTVEPGNSDIKEYIDKVDTVLAAGKVTTPSTVGQELRVNPFFRIDAVAVIDFVDPERKFTTEERMRLLRGAKDRF